MSAENEPVRRVTYVHSCPTSCSGGPGVISVIVAGGTASVMWSASCARKWRQAYMSE